MRRKTESGQAIVIGAFAMVVLLAVMGLSIDMGVLRYDKRLQQTAADAAAVAGASNLAYDSAGSPGVIDAALTASAQNGFINNAGDGTELPPTDLAVGAVAVTVHNPPIAGPHVGNSKYVEAYVSAGQPTFFMKVLGVTKETITARAVATRVSNEPGRAVACVTTTDPPTGKLTANDAGFGASGSVVLSAPDCAIVDYGNLVANGGKNLSITAASIGVGGAYDPPSGAATISPEPVTGIPNAGDPLAGAYAIPSAGPSLGGVKITGGTCSGAGCSGVTYNGGVPTIQAGTYDDICIDNNQLVNFGSGLFVITGASTCSSNVEFEINAGSIVCNSTTPCSGMPGSANDGVTFYIAGNASVNVSGTATVQLTAPNSGDYEGLLFYQSPTDSTTMNLSGNSSSLYQGTIYTANDTTVLNFGGDTNFNSLAAYTIIVVGQLQLAGNPNITIKSDYSGLANGGGPLAPIISTTVLVE